MRLKNVMLRGATFCEILFSVDCVFSCETRKHAVYSTVLEKQRPSVDAVFFLTRVHRNMHRISVHDLAVYDFRSEYTKVASVYVVLMCSTYFTRP